LPNASGFMLTPSTPNLLASPPTVVSLAQPIPGYCQGLPVLNGVGQTVGIMTAPTSPPMETTLPHFRVASFLCGHADREPVIITTTAPYSSKSLLSFVTSTAVANAVFPGPEKAAASTPLALELADPPLLSHSAAPQLTVGVVSGFAIAAALLLWPPSRQSLSEVLSRLKI
jgi:hypothetical protein